VSEGTTNTGPLAGRDPRLAEVGFSGPDKPAVDMATGDLQVREEPGDDPTQLGLQSPHTRHLGRQKDLYLGVKVDEPVVFVLGRTNVRADRTTCIPVV
jgi:hypothetical protein